MLLMFNTFFIGGAVYKTKNHYFIENLSSTTFN